MTVTIIQPKNSDGKPVPMCAFDFEGDSSRVGHDFQNMTPGQTGTVDGITSPAVLIVCSRCGALWSPS